MTLELKKAELITDYRRVILSYYKKALEGTKNGIYLEKYYKDTIEKDFTWSLQLKKPIFKKDIIELQDKEIKLIFSSDNESNTGDIFFLAFSSMKCKEFHLPNLNSMTLKDIRKLTEEDINGTTCVFKTMPGSPIAVRKHDKKSNHDTYLTVDDKTFNEELTDSVRRQLEKNTTFSKESIQHVNLVCIHGKKVVVKNYNQYLDTTSGVFLINGAIPILKYLLSVGLSSRKALGFGNVQLLSQFELN